MLLTRKNGIHETAGITATFTLPVADALDDLPEELLPVLDNVVVQVVDDLNDLPAGHPAELADAPRG